MDNRDFAQGLGQLMAALSRGRRGSYFYHTNDPDKTLAYSHYSDPAFDGEGAVIYGEKADGLHWDYADRLWQWDRAKAEAAAEATAAEGAAQGWQGGTARATEFWLSHYHGRPVRLRCIVSGTRPDNGYSWHAYGYEWGDE